VEVRVFSTAPSLPNSVILAFGRPFSLEAETSLLARR